MKKFNIVLISILYIILIALIIANIIILNKNIKYSNEFKNFNQEQNA